MATLSAWASEQGHTTLTLFPGTAVVSGDLAIAGNLQSWVTIDTMFAADFGVFNTVDLMTKQTYMHKEILLIARACTCTVKARQISHAPIPDFLSRK